MPTDNSQALFCIGGLGGSGTRVLAEILHSVGFSLGSPLNKELDNIMFSTLFKNPIWLQSASLKAQSQRLQIFHKASNGIKLSNSELKAFNLATDSNTLINLPKDFKLSQIELSKSQKWGWKEPNSLIYLNQINTFYPKIKFILMIRHGLDMAFSTNKQQLGNWGKHIFKEEWTEISQLAPPIQQLKYWLKANQTAISYGKSRMRERFIICHFEKLCLEPSQEIERILSILNESLSSEKLEELSNIPESPKSLGRYRKEDISIFTPKDIAEVFKINKI